MKVLYYDCFAGISGDMNLGAMIDLGVCADYLRSELKKLNISGFDLQIVRENRCGISGTRVIVCVRNPENEKHRHFRHIKEIILGSSLSERIKSVSLSIFLRIAEAEAKIHELDIEKVHFHEVGSLDSIVDIVGAAICLEFLRVDKVISSAIELGAGTVKCAHGIMPVPAPATTLILANIPVKTGLVNHEATTPTGAAILAEIVDEFTDKNSFTIAKTGFGIGQRNPPGIPNVLRVYLLEEISMSDREKDEILLECNIDDMNPEHYDYLFEVLFGSGISDAWITPIIMKKTRPANTLSVLVSIDKADQIKDVIFENTTTIGIRQYLVSKTMLDREERTIHTIFGDVNVKMSHLKGRLIRIKPEYEQTKKMALSHDIPIDYVVKEVLKKIDYDTTGNS